MRNSTFPKHPLHNMARRSHSRGLLRSYGNYEKEITSASLDVTPVYFG